MDLLDLLYDFSRDHNWSNILDEIKDAVIDYNDLIVKDPADAGEFIREHLPIYWQIVREHNTYRWKQEGRQLPSRMQYEVGIFLVGFSSLPNVLSIAEIQPRKKIYFIHSEDTRQKCNEITNRIEEMLVAPPDPFHSLIISPDTTGDLIDRVRCAERLEITNPSNPVEIFEQIKIIVDSLNPSTTIALDLTGGKKTMIGGGFTAGSIYFQAPKCVMFYVDSSEYDPEFGAPKPGTEFLSCLDNPSDVYNLQNVNVAGELFKRHNYEVAEQLWDKILKKLDDRANRYPFLADEQENARNYYGSSHCYHPWDAIDYNTAKSRKTFTKDSEEHSWGYDQQHTFGTAIDVLDILSEVEDKASLFECNARVVHYAVDRYQNGKRQMDRKKFEDALVRFTQVIEILCNYWVYQLVQRGKLLCENTNKPYRNDSADMKWDLIPLIRLLFRMNTIFLDGANYIVSEDEKLGLKDHGVGKIEDIIGPIEARNSFIHFKAPMIQKQTKKNAEKLGNVACKFLEKFSQDYRKHNSLTFDNLLRLHEFCQWK